MLLLRVVVLCLLATWVLALPAPTPRFSSQAAYYNDSEDADDEGSSHSGSGSKGLQVMITNRMRKVLEDELGYLAEEVDAMEPQIAGVVIERGLVRPSNGMPISWQRPHSYGSGGRGNVITRLFGSISDALSNVKSLTGRLLPAVIAVLAASMGYELIRGGGLSRLVEALPAVAAAANAAARQVGSATKVIIGVPVAAIRYSKRFIQRNQGGAIVAKSAPPQQQQQQQRGNSAAAPMRPAPKSSIPAQKSQRTAPEPKRTPPALSSSGSTTAPSTTSSSSSNSNSNRRKSKSQAQRSFQLPPMQLPSPLAAFSGLAVKRPRFFTRRPSDSIESKRDRDKNTSKRASPSRPDASLTQAPPQPQSQPQSQPQPQPPARPLRQPTAVASSNEALKAKATSPASTNPPLYPSPATARESGRGGLSAGGVDFENFDAVQRVGVVEGLWMKFQLWRDTWRL